MYCHRCAQFAHLLRHERGGFFVCAVFRNDLDQRTAHHHAIRESGQLLYIACGADAESQADRQRREFLELRGELPDAFAVERACAGDAGARDQVKKAAGIPRNALLAL